MRTPAHRVALLIVASALGATASAIALAQTAVPPARETPRPQDVDPAVNTSATPARETPRPQDIDPGVDTSSAAQAPAPGQATRAAEPAPVVPAPSAASANQTGSPASPASQDATAAASGQATKGRAVDRLELDTTQITGNRELPKVLYIVPWKRSDLGDLVGKPVNSLLDEVLTPVDRDVFKRENRYYRALTPGAAANDALSAGSDGPPGPTRNPVPTNSAPAAGSTGSATTKPSTGSGSAAPPAGTER